MAILRSKSVTAKVTPDEYKLFAGYAGDRTISEWARDVLLQATTGRPIEEAVLAEVLAMRTIILNVHFATLTGLSVNAGNIQGVIERADRDKIQRARERLVASVDQIKDQEAQ